MTSNIGANEIKQHKKLGFGDAEEERRSEKEIYMDSLKRRFKPELINRIDVICIFEPLSKQNLVDITNVMLNNVCKRLSAKGINLEIGDDVIEYIVGKGSNLEYGARPLRRFIEQEIEDKIAEKLLLGELDDHGTISITLKNNELYFEMV